MGGWVKNFHYTIMWHGLVGVYLVVLQNACHLFVYYYIAFSKVHLNKIIFFLFCELHPLCATACGRSVDGDSCNTSGSVGTKISYFCVTLFMSDPFTYISNDFTNKIHLKWFWTFNDISAYVLFKKENRRYDIHTLYIISSD